jgi:hypothetical protein
MKRILIGFVLLLVILPVSAYATDYYVDATNGDNGNLGTSPEQAWKTISKVNSMSFNPGDNIYFERNETWREILIPPSSGSSGSQITFGAYGTGNKPIITALGDLSGWTISGNWIEEVGVGTNIWSKSLAYDPDRAILDLTEYKEAEVEANITSTYRWHYDSGSTKFYVYATENPSSFYSSMEIRQDSKTVYFLDVGYITMTGLDIQSAQGAVRIRRGVGHIIIDGCDIGKYSKGGINIADSSYNEIKNNVIDSQIPDWSSDSYFESVSPVTDGIIMTTSQDTADSSYNKIYNNIVKDWGHTGISLQNIVSDTNTIHHNEIYLNEIYAQNSPDMRGWTVSGDVIGRCANNKLYQNNCHDMSVSCQVGGNDNEFYYNLIWNMAPSIAEPGIADGIRLAVEFGGDAAKICESNKVYNNIIYNITDGHGILITHWQEGTDYLENNLIRNNIIFHFPGANKHGIYIKEYPTYIKNNTFENNLIWSSGVPDIVSYYGMHKTIAEFNALDGDTGNVIKNNIASDPLFVNASNNDFHLQYNSPCIDNGTYVGLTKDYDGNAIPQGSAPDIGAYEYTGVYYVDATLGNDSYNGLYPTFEGASNGPWKTISKVNSMSFNPGDSILFKRNETWRERLNVAASGSSGSPITFGAYGSGSNPLILGSEEVIGVAGDWADQGDNVWKRALATECKVVIFDSTNFGVEDATPDAQYEWDWVTNELFVYSVGNPTGYYTSIEASQRAYCIYVGTGGARDYITIDGIDSKAAGTFNIFFQTGSTNPEVKNLTSSYSRQVGVYLQGANGAFNIDNVTTEYTGSHGIAAIDQTAGTIQNCECSYWSCTTSTWYHALNIHGSSNLTIEYNHFHHINTGGTGGGIGGDRYNNCIIQYNEINNYYVAGIDVTGSTGEECYSNIVRYNLVHDGDTTMGCAIQVNVNVGYTDATYDNEVYYNIIYNDKRGIMLTGDVNGNKVYNNIIYNVTAEGLYLDTKDSKSPSNNILKNNIVHTAGGKLIMVDAGLFGDGNVADNNCFYDSDFTNKFRYGGSTYSTLGDWQSGTSQDANSINSDPLFVNAPNDDFHLQPNSPCIDAGTNVGLTQDFEGNPIINTPDIGAYEYAGGISGDLSGDGIVDIIDLGVVAGDFGKTSNFDPRADVVPNNEIDVFDVVFVASRFT